MLELFETFVQTAFGIGLVYGMVLTLRYSSETIPMGASNDELANHPAR